MTSGFVNCDLTGAGVIHKGAVNHLKHYRILYSAAEVVLVLGDIDEVAESTGASISAVKHWRKKNRIPRDYGPRIRELLAARRYAVALALFA